jgi:drug/metabolite transporter (DMT)-like permease
MPAVTPPMTVAWSRQTEYLRAMSVATRFSNKFDALSPIVRAAIWTVAASFCVVAFTAIGKHLAQDGLPIAMIVFLRCVFGILFLLPWLKRNGLKGLHTQQPALMASRGVNTMIGLYCTFSAFALMPMADVTAIAYTKPIFGAIAAVLFLREVMYGSRWIATALGFIGMLVIIRPGLTEWNIGVLWALGAMASGAYTSITVKFLTRTEPPDRIVAYLILVMFVVSALPAALDWKTPTIEELCWMALLALLANYFQHCMARGYAAADAAAVLPFEFARLAIAAIFGFVFFGEISDQWTWGGGIIIFGSALFMVHAERRRKTSETRAAA